MAKFLYSRYHHKPNNKLTIIVIFICFGALFCIAFYVYLLFVKSPRDVLIDKYIDGLKNKDRDEISNMLAPEYDGEKAIDNDVNKFGGLTFAINTGYTPCQTDGQRSTAHLWILKGFRLDKKDVTIRGVENSWNLIEGDLKSGYKL